jgi:2-polyprenyl-3-methyl-5-hydroxy-6-metoxy-1,4-benzoquinol methylase
MNKSEKFWDLLSKIYDEETQRFEQMYIKTAELTKHYLSKNNVVLEIGCGTGTLTNDIANCVKVIHAIDFSTRMIDIAKRKANECKINNIEFKQATIFDVKYKGESFDVILAFNTLHCIEAVEITISRIYELLKPEGLFISVTPSSGSEKKTFKEFLQILRYILFILSRIGFFPIPYMNSFKTSELENLMVKAGFHITKTESIHTTEGHYYIVCQRKHNQPIQPTAKAAAD